MWQLMPLEGPAITKKTITKLGQPLHMGFKSIFGLIRTIIRTGYKTWYSAKFVLQFL